MIDGDDIIGKYTLRALGSQLLPIKNKTCYQHCNALSSVYYTISISLSLCLSQHTKDSKTRHFLSKPHSKPKYILLIFTCTEYSTSTQRVFEQTIVESLPPWVHCT